MDGFIGGTIYYQSDELPTIGSSTGQTVDGTGNTVPKGTAGGYVTVDQTIKGYATLDLRAGIAAKDGSWRLMIWGKKVINKLYSTYVGRGFDTSFRYVGLPVTVGVTLGLKVH